MPADDTTSHATRHPGKAVQAVRARKKVAAENKPTDAEKATRAITQGKKKLAEQALNDDIDAFFALRGRTITELAAKHDVKPEYIRARLLQSSQFKATRAPSLRDGTALLLPEIHRRADIVMADPDLIDPEDKRQWMEELLAYPELQRVGLRASNKAAAVDIWSLAKRLETEAITAFERTGCRIVILMTRGHINDEAMPTSIESGGAGEFFIEGLGIPLAELTWISMDHVVRDTRASMQSQTSKLVEDGLRTITDDSTVTMSYKNMDVEIKELHGVEIVGWPADIPFVCPSQVKTVERLRRLRDGWLKDTIHWAPMSDTDVADLAEDLAARRAASEDGLLMKRKQRSDAGGEHRKTGQGKMAEKGKAVGKAADKGKKTGKKAGNKTKAKAKSHRRRDDEDEDPEQDVDEEVPTPPATYSHAPTSIPTIPTSIPVPAPPTSHADGGLLPLPGTDTTAAFPPVVTPLLDGGGLPVPNSHTLDDAFLDSLGLPEFDLSDVPQLSLQSLAGPQFGQHGGMSTFAPSAQLSFDHNSRAEGLVFEPTPLSFDDHLLPPLPYYHMPDAGSTSFNEYNTYTSAPEFPLDALAIETPAFPLNNDNTGPLRLDAHHGPALLPVETQASVAMAQSPDVPAVSAGQGHGRETDSTPSFIAYQPPAALRDASNGTGRKRKAPAGEKPAEGAKKRKVTAQSSHGGRSAAPTAHDGGRNAGPSRPKPRPITSAQAAALLASQLPPGRP
ncbi:hypothetical protein C8R43DRAFT_1143593 [Mycena crocata]|nr:hypothetical protein C8R43DRAFT_1143593 [Mycena crocata]